MLRFEAYSVIKISTRMHSSRMRTIRRSSRLLGGGVCQPGGCLPGGGCLPARGRLPAGGVFYLPGQCLPGGGGVCPGGCLADTPTPMDRMTDTCENITLPQLHCGR